MDICTCLCMESNHRLNNLREPRSNSHLTSPTSTSTPPGTETRPIALPDPPFLNYLFLCYCYYYYYYYYCYCYYYPVSFTTSFPWCACWLRRNPGKLFLPFRHPLPTVSLLYRPVYSFITESIGLLELLIWKLVIPVSTRLDSTRYPILPYHHTDTSIDARPRSDEDKYIRTHTHTHIRTEYIRSTYIKASAVRIDDRRVEVPSSCKYNSPWRILLVRLLPNHCYEPDESNHSLDECSMLTLQCHFRSGLCSCP